MLHIYNADHVAPLAQTLAQILKTPLPDPMAAEVVVTPTAGMSRWLSIELARTLGATDTDRNDGISANIKFAFTNHLTKAILVAYRGAASSDGQQDPWEADNLAWAILDVLCSHHDDARLKVITDPPAGATMFGRARRIADMFDRYMTRRPRLITQWAAGNNVDVAENALSDHDLWQPHLWRLLRKRIGIESPPEMFPRLLADVKSGALELALPARLCVFGLTTLPLGAQFIDLVEAIAEHRDLHLMMLDPSHSATQKIKASVVPKPRHDGMLRAADNSDDLVANPLLRSWGRPYRERAILLATAGPDACVEATVSAHASTGPSPANLLKRIQRDIRENVGPNNDFDLSPADRSIQIHDCHGRARQVEVLRDAILHLLATDKTLTEDDIVVICPDINTFAQLVKAGFGPSADSASFGAGASSPALRYRVTDRSLRDAVPLLAALGDLLVLVTSKCTRPELLDFMSCAPVAEKFGFTAEAMNTINYWAEKTHVRWGLDGQHREQWGIPTKFAQNSWFAALDRVLVGVALTDSDLVLAPGEIAPFEVNETEAGIAGRFAEFLYRFRDATHELRTARTVAQWCDTLTRISDDLFAVPQKEQAQLEQLRKVITDIADEAVVDDAPAELTITLADLRQLLGRRLDGPASRSEFFMGGITVTSLTPLRWLPYRVVCLLGLDDDALRKGASLPDGDDLAASSPLLGDRDPRSETRQALLEAVLAAGDNLLITRTGHSLQNNNAVPPSVVVSEFNDAIVATLSSESAKRFNSQIAVTHPCQAFDARCFIPGELGTDGPAGFDQNAFAGAIARLTQAKNAAPLFSERLDPIAADGHVVTIQQLKSFIGNPIESFVKNRLGISIPGKTDTVDDNLPTDLDGLEKWSVRDRLLTARLAGHDYDTWERHEMALGTLPVGDLADKILEEADELVGNLVEAANFKRVSNAVLEAVPFDITLDNSGRLVGEIGNRLEGDIAGPAIVTCSHLKPSDLLKAWIDLMCLVITHPERDFESVLICRAKKGNAVTTTILKCVGSTPQDRRMTANSALARVVDCFERGMREPLPLYAEVLQKRYAGEKLGDSWRDFNGHGDGDSPLVMHFFGDLPNHELLELPTLDHDPPLETDRKGSGRGRVDRFAQYLWGAFETSHTQIEFAATSEADDD